MLKSLVCLSFLPFSRVKNRLLNKKIDGAWLGISALLFCQDQLLHNNCFYIITEIIAVITTDAAVVQGHMETRLMCHYNGRWPTSLVYASKPLMTVIRATQTVPSLQLVPFPQESLYHPWQINKDKNQWKIDVSLFCLSRIYYMKWYNDRIHWKLVFFVFPRIYYMKWCYDRIHWKLGKIRAPDGIRTHDTPWFC